MSKRKKADQTDWSEVDLKRLTLKDLRQLLQTREIKDIPNKRAEMEQVLKTTQVEIDYTEDMTMKQLAAELRLRGFDDSNARKEVYLQRLHGEIAAPPKKKSNEDQKKRKHRAHGTKVFVSLYEKPAEDEEDGTIPMVLGVFTHEGEAYDCTIDKLMEDLKKKDEKTHTDLNKEITNKPGAPEVMQKVLDRCTDAYGEAKEPHAWVLQSKVA